MTRWHDLICWYSRTLSPHKVIQNDRLPVLNGPFPSGNTNIAHSFILSCVFTWCICKNAPLSTSLLWVFLIMNYYYYFFFFTWYEKRIIFCTRVPVSFRLSLSNLMVQIRPTCIQTSPHRSTDSVTWVHWHSGNSSDTDITITSLFYYWDIKCVHILTVHNAQFRYICFNVTSAFKMSLCWVSNVCMYTEKWRNPWLRDKNPPKKNNQQDYTTRPNTQLKQIPTMKIVLTDNSVKGLYWHTDTKINK